MIVKLCPTDTLPVGTDTANWALSVTVPVTWTESDVPSPNRSTAYPPPPIVTDFVCSNPFVCGSPQQGSATPGRNVPTPNPVAVIVTSPIVPLPVSGPPVRFAPGSDPFRSITPEIVPL